MGVYSLNSIQESSNYLDDVQEKEIYTEDFMEAGLQNVYENVCNFNAMMKSIGVAELAVYESTGEEMIYEAGTLSSLFDKIKAMLKKIWEKMKSLFTKFMAKMQSFGKDDKAFVTKYRKEILAGSTKDLNIKGFIFTENALDVGNGWTLMKKELPNFLDEKNIETNIDNLITSKLGAGQSTTDMEKDSFGESESEFNDKLRAACLKQTGEMDAKEFNDTIFEKFRNGDSKPQTLEDTDIKKGEIINFLMNSANLEKPISKDMKDTEKTINGLIRVFDKKSNSVGKFNSTTDKTEIEKRGDLSSYLSKCSRHLNEALSILQVLSAARMKAFNDKRKQYKSICVKLIGRKAKNEGYEYDDEYDSSYNEQGYESILGNIKFI